MNKTLVTIALAAGLALVGLTPAVLAGHDNSIDDTQNVVTANPLTLGLRSFQAEAEGETVAVGDCTTSRPTEGTAAADATWYDNIEEFQNHTFRVTVDATLDVDPFFFNANDRDDVTNACWQMDSDHPWIAGYGGLGVWEYGKVPSNATHMAIDHFSGVGAFTLEIPNQACSAAPNCPPPSAD